MSGWKIEIVAKAADIPVWSDALDPHAVAIAAFEIVPGGDWRIEAYTVDDPDPEVIEAVLKKAAAAQGRRLPGWHLTPLPKVDWLAENRRAFPPQQLGRFFVHGSHYEGALPPGSYPLLLDAATAFGSGEHATTRGCLLALERLAHGRWSGRRRRPRRLLDLGCGSGILAIGMHRLWRHPVEAYDIDPESVRVARENMAHNRVARAVRVGRSDGYRRVRGRFDLVVANILARPLCKLAPDLRRHLAPGGVAVLSGLLVAQEAQVLAAHRAQRLSVKARTRRDGWSTLVVGRR